MSKPLKTKEIEKRLEKLAGWSVNKKQTQISKTFATKDFVTGLMFLARTTIRSEMINHHPDVTLSYQKVRVVVTTHSEASLTKLDFDLAKQIDEIYTRNHFT